MKENYMVCNCKQVSYKDIADALISLMKKKDFNKITNKDITNRAGLSHITILLVLINSSVNSSK